MRNRYKYQDKLISFEDGMCTYESYQLLGGGVMFWRVGLAEIVDGELVFDEQDVSVSVMNRLDCIRAHTSAKNITLPELIQKMQTYS